MKKRNKKKHNKKDRRIKTVTQFTIAYNPYTGECVFKKNGKELGSKSKLGSKSSERLQMLLGKSTNWNGLVEEIVRACNDKAIQIDFSGRKIDYEDLEASIRQYEQDHADVKFECYCHETSNDEDIIGRLDELFQDIWSRNLPQFQEKNKDGKNIFDAYEEVKNGIFEISVIATMSSGKSTLINSLLHTELLPSKNEACTATVARIYDEESDDYEAECYAQDDKTVVYERKKVNLEMLREYNEDEQVTYINIFGSIPAITSGRIRLCLMDTPGPNNSRNENHELLTKSIIQQTNSVILYVMNVTQFGIDDDEQLLKDISEEMKRAGKQSRDRFVFVVNKCDELDPEKGEKVDEFLEKAKDYLKNLGIQEPTVIPASARSALLIRKNQKGVKLSRKEDADFRANLQYSIEDPELHFENYAVLTPTVREKLKRELEQYQKDGNKEMEALIHSGIPAVEATINEYIEKYAYPIKIHDAVKDIDQILKNLNMEARFQKSIAEDSDKLKRVRKQIQEAKDRHKGSQEAFISFKEKMEAFGLKQNSLDDVRFKIETTLNGMTKKYSEGKKLVDKSEVDHLITNFQTELGKYQEKCAKELNRKIESEVFYQGNLLLDQYVQTVTEVLDDIEIEDYEFQKIPSFQNIRISNIEDIKRRNEQDRYRQEKRWKNNPEREGFFGFFKFFEPKKISYMVTVKDGTDINIYKVVLDIAVEFKKQIDQNINNMFRQAESQVKKYKAAFIENLGNLDYEIKRILEQLDKDTASSMEIEKRVKENKELAAWAAEKEENIRSILNF